MEDELEEAVDGRQGAVDDRRPRGSIDGLMVVVMVDVREEQEQEG